MFLSFTRPRAELTRRYLPSKSNQTGVTCGLPFDITVARLANAFFVVTRSRNSGGIVPRVAACWGEWPPPGGAAWTPRWPKQAHPQTKSPGRTARRIARDAMFVIQPSPSLAASPVPAASDVFPPWERSVRSCVDGLDPGASSSSTPAAVPVPAAAAAVCAHSWPSSSAHRLRRAVPEWRPAPVLEPCRGSQ